MATQFDDVLNVQRGPAVTGAGGDDTYLFSDALVEPGATINISDTQGTNTLQFVSLSVASATVANDTLQLILDNGAEINVLGASSFTYEVGGNATTGEPGTEKGYATFAQDDLGVSVPASGDSPNENNSVDATLGSDDSSGSGSSSGGGSDDTNTVTGTSADETFNLSPGQDNIDGKGGDDSFDGTVSNQTNRDTFSPGDSIDGGDGTDTLEVELSGSNYNGNVDVDNIERIFLETTDLDPRIFEAEELFNEPSSAVEQLWAENLSKRGQDGASEGDQSGRLLVRDIATSDVTLGVLDSGLNVTAAPQDLQADPSAVERHRDAERPVPRHVPEHGDYRKRDGRPTL